MSPVLIRGTDGDVTVRRRRSRGLLVSALFLLLLAGGLAWWTRGAEWQAALSSLPELERLTLSQGAPEAAHYYLGRRLLEAGRASESYAAFARAAEAFPRSQRLKTGEIEALVALQRWRDAERKLAGLPAADTANVQLGLLRARVYVDGLQQPGRARDVMERLVRRFPRHAEAHYQLGRAYAALYQPQKSLPAFREARRLDPRQFAYRRELAQTYLYTGQLREALDELREAQRLNPSDPTTLYLFGGVLAQLARTPEEQAAARNALLAAAERHPGDPEVQCQLGQLAQDARDFREAAQRFDQCLLLDPAHSDAVYRLAQCRFRLGQEKEGQRLLAVYARLRTLAKAGDSDFAAGKEELSAAQRQSIARLYQRAGFAELARIVRSRSGSGPGGSRAPAAGSGDERVTR